MLDLEAMPVALTPRGSPASGGGDADRTVVWLQGEHDVVTVHVVRETLGRAVDLDDADVLVDLSGVEFMGAATVGEILRAHSLLHQRARALAVRAPSRPALRILDVCGLTHLLDESAAGDTHGLGSADSATARLAAPATPPPSRRVPVSLPAGHAPASATPLGVAAAAG